MEKKKVEKIYLHEQDKRCADESRSAGPCLRRVMFTLREYEFDPNLTEEQRQEEDQVTREREGLFHRWTEVEKRSAESGNIVNEFVALIEDPKTGKVHHVDTNLMRFVD